VPDRSPVGIGDGEPLYKGGRFALALPPELGGR
jgi:hypothetical protein